MSEKIFEAPEQKEVHELEYEVDTVNERTGSSYGAYYNIVSIIAGTGTLQLPFALNQAGWIGALIILIATLMAIYTGNLLIKCLYYDGVNRLHDIPAVGEAAFGKPGKYFLRVFHYSILLGATCIYIMLIGLNINTLLEMVNVNIDKKIWIAIGAVVVLIPYLFLKTVKEVAWLSAMGVLTTACVIVICVVAGLVEYSVDNVRNDHDIVRWANLPVALGSICFSFGGNVIYPHVEAGMRNPKSWNKVLGCAIMTVCVMYLLISVCCYFVFGVSTVSPIYDNLKGGGAKVSAILLITIHIIMASPLYLTSFANEMEELLKINRQHHSKAREFILRSILRTIILGSCTLVAMFVPFVSDFMSLIGSLSYSIILFMAPVTLYIKLYGFKKLAFWEKIACTLIMIIALSACILGTKDAVIQFSNSVHGEGSSAPKH
ncbi:hypothetical protein K493DRAFT_317724 [Basidiobolus meristosporus CBS 931.73]|uniref:Amino acid transporter transmembrane domain-containing protein n=1 Tax=Basidiobolus meristosporus CBS 931.73 TaxID=1314790 RepID=A0A1Y1XYI1_9FUNG|nr:hypothetical protein K493DRAFT_317724 [Basidiobolus meristosporus CBS 931.73]|eukprot:ORX90798.1 hypothetical protein K493DRAFT_317724 [Basidiobolus meristosporus CBS 931.73]